MSGIKKLCGCVKGSVAPMTVFETVTAGRKFYNADMKCDFAGNKMAEMVAKGELSVDKALDDVISYAKRIMEGDGGKKSETHMLSWMCMHLALGLCHKFNIKDRKRVRSIMQDILPYSRGIDNGIFYRDTVAFGGDSQYLDVNEKEMLEKAMYYLRMAACFKIDMPDEQYARSIYGNVVRRLPKSAYYIDLPLGNPAFALGTAPPSRANALQTAVESMKPDAVLLMLRYGASAHGEPLNYVLASLSHAKTVEEKTKHKASESPLGQVRTICSYLLRCVNHLRLRFDEQRIGDMDHDEDVYFVSSNITHFLEDRFYKQPNNLRHLCRTKIRELVRGNDGLPEALYTLPKLITTHKRYLDILS